MAKLLDLHSSLIGSYPISSTNNGRETTQVDINNLLIETDYPYLSDSEDLLIKVFEKICLIRQIDEKLMNNQLTENAKRLFYKLN